MRRLLLAAVVGGPAALTLLVLLAALVGRAPGAAAAPLADSERCPLPCWHGIVPGAMYAPRAAQVLTGLGYDSSTSELDRAHIFYTRREAAPGCAVRLEHFDAVVTEIRLSRCPGLRLGDVQAALGPPDGVQPGLLAFAFRGGRVRVKLAADGCAPRLSPYLPVSYISLSANGALAGDAPWRGFMPPARYLRLYPGSVLLSC